MMTVDRWALAASALAILGLSTALAAVSYHVWLARERGARTRDAFARPSFTVFWSSGMCAAAAGYALLRRAHPWEWALAVVVAGSFLWDLLALLRARSVVHSPPDR
jgi:hypothetical protein